MEAGEVLDGLLGGSAPRTEAM